MTFHVKFVLSNRQLKFNDMKKSLILTALFAITIGFYNAQTTPIAVDGKYFNPSGEPFTGSATIESNEGDVTSVQEIEVVNGLLHGTVRYFNQEGTLTEVGNYSLGLKNGQWLQWTVWDEAGVKRYHMVYSQGKKVDTWKMWDEHANLVSERIYKD